MKKNSIDLVPVILAGGVGERLWPISRHSRPKQFAEIFDKTLFEKTLDRVKALNSIYKPIVITNFEYRFIVKELSEKNKTKVDSIILEPTPKNTAPAFLLASLNVLKVHGNKNILFLPSDHIMKDDNAFVKLINRSINFLNDKNIITFGIQPREKNSEYGYIEIDQKQKNSTKPNNVKKFIEKPKNKLLDKIHANKNFFWNSGIYFCKASVIDQLTQEFDPILYDLTSKAYKNKKNEFDCDLVSEKYFRKIKPISIDYAVMEHAKNLLLVKFNSIWSDLGSWNSINQYVKKDNNLNFKKGDVILHQSKNSMVFSESRLCVLSNVDDLIIIDCRDVLFVTKNNQGGDKVKELLKFLSDKYRKEVEEYPVIKRPWGYYEVFIVGQNYLVKKILIKPKSSISLQKHRFRSEHWVVVSGKGKFYLNKDVIHIKINESIYIPKGKKHKIENIGSKDLIIVEVQTGSHLSEDDIIRYSDNYGRT